MFLPHQTLIYMTLSNIKIKQWFIPLCRNINNDITSKTTLSNFDINDIYDSIEHRIITNSREVHQEAAPRRSSFDGEPARDSQGGSGVHLPAAGWERHRLEGHPRRHHARELHQQHRCELQHRGHHVRFRVVLMSEPRTRMCWCFGLKPIATRCIQFGCVMFSWVGNYLDCDITYLCKMKPIWNGTNLCLNPSTFGQI